MRASQAPIGLWAEINSWQSNLIREGMGAALGRTGRTASCKQEITRDDEG